MASLGLGKRSRFTIEDAFEEEPEDAIRLYGSTQQTRPLNAAAQKYRVDSPGPPPTAALLHPPVHFSPDPSKEQHFNDTTSNDSDSLIGPASSDGLASDERDVWWAHPKVRDNRKVVVCAFVLMIVGTMLLVAGVVIAAAPIRGFQALVFLMAGALCFIPGAYHIVFVYLAVKGRRGYSFQQLPLFN